MQDRRHRPGDVLDDYCPRERRITDHAIVAMIDDEIRQTRCGICDAEHEYKGGKVPTPRRKTQPPALFTQVLDTMNGPVPQAPAPHPAAAVIEPEPVMMAAAGAEPPAAVAAPKPDRDTPANPDTPETQDLPESQETGENPAPELEGGFRRSLIRATFPRPDGQAPPPRALPEFTIQSLNNRRNNNGQRHAGGANKFRGGRRRPGAAGGSQDNLGPMRFRDHGSQQGDRPQGQGQGGGRRRRGGKKNR
jgi:hypothetical protein